MTVNMAGGSLPSLGEHVITPKYGSIRDSEGKPSWGLHPYDFPVTAVCLECSLPIRLEKYYFAEWSHVIRQAES
jgi:hypothetical protein